MLKSDLWMFYIITVYINMINIGMMFNEKCFPSSHEGLLRLQN